MFYYSILYAEKKIKVDLSQQQQHWCYNAWNMVNYNMPAATLFIWMWCAISANWLSGTVEYLGLFWEEVDEIRMIDGTTYLKGER